MHTVALATGALAVVPFLAADAPGSTYHYVDGKNFKLEEYVRLAQPDGAQDCPYLSQNVPGTMASPCFQADCAADSDGCPCLLYQMEYCAQPEVLAADPNCGSVSSWDPIVVAAVEKCRAAQTAQQSFAGCPFLDQTDGLQQELLTHGTPCRHEDCLVDSDGCSCRQFQQLYCSQVRNLAVGSALCTYANR